MKLGINIVRLSRQFTGVGRYIECLLNEWSKTGTPFEEIILYSHTAISQADVIFPLGDYTLKTLGQPRPDPIWEYQNLRSRPEVDLMFFPSYTIPIGNKNRCVVTYHGPSDNLFGTKEWLRSYLYDKLYNYSANHSEHVFVVSDAVKKRVLNHYLVNDKKITTTLLAASSVFKKIDDEELLRITRRQYSGSDAPYILFVGKLSRRHFIPELINAYAKIVADYGPPHKLLIAGPDYLNLNIPEMAENIGLQERIKYVPYIQHQELPAVYNAADFFVFPASHIEGFGLPVIEAMSCGTPTISTDQGSIPEFARGAALLVDNNDTESLASAMMQLIQDGQYKQAIGLKGYERAKTLSWRNTAKSTIARLWDVAINTQ